MDENEKIRFKQILSTHFNDNIKDLNDALNKHIELITYKKEFNKMMYMKNKESDAFIQKKKEYDTRYYEQNKDSLLSKRKHKYDNDIDFKEQIKLKQKARYGLNKLNKPLFKSTSKSNPPLSLNVNDS